MRSALPALAKALWETDTEVISDACWALSYVSDGSNERLQAVIDAGVLTQIVRPSGPLAYYNRCFCGYFVLVRCIR